MILENEKLSDCVTFSSFPWLTTWALEKCDIIRVLQFGMKPPVVV